MFYTQSASVVISGQGFFGSHLWKCIKFLAFVFADGERKISHSVITLGSVSSGHTVAVVLSALSLMERELNQNASQAQLIGIE